MSDFDPELIDAIVKTQQKVARGYQNFIRVCNDIGIEDIEV